MPKELGRMDEVTVIKIGSNITSLNAQRRLNEASASLSKTFERLSSGLRINSASDDAAGLAISSTLNSDRKVFLQGVRNLNDGISLLNVADGALEQLSNITTRLKELAEQAANGTYGAAQRKAIDTEAQALSKEYFRIERSTKFNGKGIFFAEFGKLRLQAGFGTTGGIESGLGGAIGTGSFSTATSYAMETNSSYAVELADLNGDGNLDMVTAGQVNGGAGYSFVRLGTGDGSFGAATSYASDTGTSYALSLGDLNGDGIVDLVTAGQGGLVGKATIRLGLGNGTFGAATSYTMEFSNSFGVKLGDLNGDGNLDLVTAGTGSGTGTATIRLGSGSGTFGAAISYATEGTSSSALTLGDLNGDGILDLVTSGYGADGTTTVRLGTGSGTFGSAKSYITHVSSTTSIVLGDVNGDEILDLVAAGDESGNGSAVVMLGTGSGTFGAARSYSTEGSYSTSVVLGDINGDGFLDLVTAGSSATGATTIRLGSGNGTFGTATSYVNESGVSYGVKLGDLNNDGVLDLITSGETSGLDGYATTRLSNTVDGVSPLLAFKLNSRANALQALSQFTKALDRISTQRGTIGAFQSRIGYASNVLQITAENYAAAASRIQDVDMAEEAANLVRTQILQQAASAILAQANQQPALALRLLGG